jgi:hypothetical protein
MNQKLLNSREKWPDIASDMAIVELDHREIADDGQEVGLTWDELKEYYNLSDDDLQVLNSNELFRGMVLAEKKRVQGLGETTGHVFRGEAIMRQVSALLLQRLHDDDPSLKISELLECWKVFARSIGLDAPAELARLGREGAQVAVQINIPDLGGDKLSHLRKKIE